MRPIYEESLPIYFEDADPGQVVFFGRFFSFAHRVLENFVKSSPIGWKMWFGDPRWIVPIRHAESNFFKPLRPGEDYKARLFVAELGNSSVTFKYEFLDSTGVCAEVKTTHVFVDPQARKRMNIPAEVRAHLEPGQENR